jgi:hypothetical protein
MLAKICEVKDPLEPAGIRSYGLEKITIDEFKYNSELKFLQPWVDVNGCRGGSIMREI